MVKSSLINWRKSGRFLRGWSDQLLGKMTKTIGAARQQRERSLMDFRAACEDLEEEIEPPRSGTHNERRVKTKMKLVRTSYDDVMTAQAQLVSLEKTSGAEETNWNWVKTNVRKPFKDVIEKAEDVLIDLIGEEDPEKETKALVEEAKRDAKRELVRFEATAVAMVELRKQLVKQIFGCQTTMRHLQKVWRRSIQI